MSFHHRVDNVISIHTYGTNYVASYAYWGVKTAGTQYRLPDAAVKLLIDYYLDGICKASAFGIYPDIGAENRDLSRKGTVHAAGIEIPQNLLQASSYRKDELEDIFRSDVTVKTKSGLAKAERGQRSLADVDWILHDSVAYLFPKSTTINLFDSTATGNWRLITHQAAADRTPVQKDVFMLWLAHGLHPQAESYQYTVLPAVDAKSVEAYQKVSNVVVLANTPALQAVQKKSLQLSQVVFYQPGSLSITKDIMITAESPCLVMIRLNGNKVKQMSVSDPTHKLSDLQLRLSLPLNASGEG